MSLIKINYHQIFGSSHDENSPFSIDGIGFEPESVLNSVSKDLIYYQCPAWKHKASRTFLIKCPVDINLSVDLEQKTLHSSNLNQWQFNEYCHETFVENWCSPEKTTIQLSIPRFIFWTNQKNIWIESRPHFNTVINNNLIAVSGWFNLSSYVRPISVGFDVVDVSKPIIIKRGDPLLEVCFYSNDLNSAVSLNKEDLPKKILEEMQKRGRLFSQISSHQLGRDIVKKQYESMFKKQKSKCPFEFMWK